MTSSLGDSEESNSISTAVGIDKDKNSQSAVKWAIEKLRLKNNRIVLVHVKLQPHADPSDVSILGREPNHAEIQQLFLPYRSFCARKGIRVKEVVLHGVDVASTLCEYLRFNHIKTIVVGASSRGVIFRAFKHADVPTCIVKHAPDFCKVLSVSKGKMLKLKAPKDPDTPNSETSSTTSSHDTVKFRPQESWKSATSSEMSSYSVARIPQQYSVNNNEYMSSASVNTNYESVVMSTDFSTTNFFMARQPMLQPNLHVRTKDIPAYSMSGTSEDSDLRSSPSDVSSASNVSQSEFEDELKKLKQEMNEITLTYNIACHGTEARSFEENSLEESAMSMMEREKMRCNAALEIAQKAQRIAELESEKRKRAEMRFQSEKEQRIKAVDALAHTEVQYRKYTVEEIQKATNNFSASDKVGEGGYGPVFLARLDHTAVAIKVVRPDISQGEKQFQREVEVLSRMRHPHMVILLGACPENGCLVYEYMDNGSLEDRLYRKNGTAPLSWQTRFRIAAEISTALNFLHRTRPEPLVHRDLKPANILLDRNNVSKISDVGLSRLVPANVADSITQCCMTAAAGTFCYIDPEYQQTGMLGTKSDIYSLGVVLLQIITGKAAMGLTHCVESAIENEEFVEILDPTVKDWPIEETLSYAKLALRCCELRRRDRPDLHTEILPQLQQLRDLAASQSLHF